MSELKPCPFCGCEPTSSDEFDDEVLFYGCTKDIDCPLYDAPFVNMANWNNRPIEDALNARIAELEGLVDKLIEIGDRLVFPDGVFDDEQSVIERDWRILTKAVKEREE